MLIIAACLAGNSRGIVVVGLIVGVADVGIFELASRLLLREGFAEGMEFSPMVIVGLFDEVSKFDCV